MSEQFSKVFNLFDYPAAIRTPWTSGATQAIQDTNPTKMFFIVYLDGRVQINGQAYLDTTLPNFPIVDGQILFDISQIPDLVRLLPPENDFGIADSGINMFAKLPGVGPSAEIGYASFIAASNHIIYQEVSGISFPTGDIVWQFTGWLVPRRLTKTSTLLWGK